MPFKYHNHTADVLIEARGKNLAVAFEESAKGMFGMLTDITKVKPSIEHSIIVEAKTKEKLLFDFLDELIFLMDTELTIFSKFDIKIKGRYVLECKAFGDLASNYETHGDIKAPTYNEMSIKESKENATITFVVDI